MNYPKKIDNANVKYWADVSGLEKTSYVKHSNEKGIQLNFFKIAICQYDKSNEVYLFHCNESWDPENDDLFGSIDEAMESAIRQYSGLTKSMFNVVKQ